MKKYKEFINEGLRDKMLPKTEEEIISSFQKYFEGLKVVRHDETIEKISYLDMNNLYLIYDWEDHFEFFDKYFKELIKKNNRIGVIKYHEDVSYVYYKKERIMSFYDGVLTDGWYFEGIHINNIIKYISQNY